VSAEALRLRSAAQRCLYSSHRLGLLVWLAQPGQHEKVGVQTVRDVAVVVPHCHPIWGRGFWLVNRVRSCQPFFYAPCVPLAFLMRRELKRRPELSPKGKGSESAWMVWRACGSEQSGATERGLAASPSALGRPTPMIGGLPVPRERPSSSSFLCARALVIR
jgi:hypothetical protein